MVRKTIGSLRNNYVISKLLVAVFRPLNRLMVFASKQIQMKVKVNGGRVKYDGFTLAVPKNVGVGFMSNIFWKGVDGFEPYTWQAIRNSCRNAEVFFDVGSHFGFYSVLVQRLNPLIVTRCFEPVPELYRDNIVFHQKNGATRQTIINKAISESVGEIEIQIPVHQTAREVRSASIEKDFYFNQKFKTRSFTILTTTLDSELAENPALKGKKVVLKIDIEGHEWAALKGGSNFLSTVKPVVICEIDKSSGHLIQVLDCFRSANFKIYAIVKEGLFRIGYDDVSKFKGGRDFAMIHTDSQQSYVPFDHLNTFAWGK
jgi:FkbM family methyltransferase